MNRHTLDLRLSSFMFDGRHPSHYRDRVGVIEERDPNYDNRYDFHTLIYDCFFDRDAGEVVLICPSLLNFRCLIEQARFSIDGTGVQIKAIDALSRGNVIRFQSPVDAPAELGFEHKLFSGAVAVNALHTDVFAGKNAVYAISKDNKLDWIQDWLAYYVKEHGANAVVIYDNHSTDYSMDALKETLASVDGIEASAVVRAWFPFGPGGAGNTNFNSKFLHMTMVELGRRRLLSQARAVLNVDIDELVYSRSGASIFDATVASEQGYVRIDGRWAFADPPEDGALIRHADHQFIRSDGKPKVNRKYCVAPQGPLKGRPWLTHRIISRRDPTDPDFGFWHFRRITNNWDYNREDFDTNLLEVSPRLSETMSRVYGTTPKTPAKPKPEAGEVERRRAETPLLITAMKNEGPYILEWVAYHRAIGFEQFLVYTNDCSDGTDLILDRMAELGLLTHERNNVLRRGPQKSALKYAFDHPATARADWILVSDVDEFLNIKVGEGRLDDLLNAVPEADVIPVTWRLFSNNARVDFSDNLVIEDYTDAELPIENGGQERRFVKSLFRPRPEITRFGTHGPVHEPEDFAKIRWIAPDGGSVDPKTCTRPRAHFSYPVAQINHYATRSVDSYLVKRDRGRVNHFRDVMGMDYWTKMSRGGQKDTSITRWIDPTLSEMARIAQDKKLAELLAASTEWHKQRIADLRAQPEYEALRSEILGAGTPAVAE
ncbi:glycosyltransferase family 2 protein [Ruegeria sp. 2205SS24-7]|uniref:glycosyltransferase family 2 protein n=1 Tax=Ruegeria discodermiae TaxID=3064389 RepID=UPI0027426AEE|nr:glycosyltransferase family 2 protein [Ruegeria sp. 2205SS24-7]MDP5217564.1 glycosyltransferase family 2 protein [Ruegeria sp. 2205SS24-7]